VPPVVSAVSVLSPLAETTVQDLERKLTLDSQTLQELYYVFAIAVLWLLVVGFTAYEAGLSRRKNVLTAAMKCVLTLAVVAPAFYYGGWTTYGCFQEGWPKHGYASPELGGIPGLCGSSTPWSSGLGPDLQNHLSLVLFLSFCFFAVTAGLIMSGALVERVRVSAYLVLAVVLGALVWSTAAAWSWSSAGWLTTRYGFHDAMASGALHGVAGFFTLGVLLNLGPRIGRYDSLGRARTFGAHNTPLAVIGMLLVFVGFLGFYAAGLAIQSTTFPGWLNVYLSPTTLGTVAMSITFGLAGGLTGGWFTSRGNPLLTLSGGLAGIVTVSAGADVYHPSLAYVLGGAGGGVAVWVGRLVERRLRLDDVAHVVSVHGVCGFLGVLLVGIVAGGYPTGPNNVPVSFGGQAVGVLALLPLAFLSGYAVSWVLRKVRLLRVPPEVEVAGLDETLLGTSAYPDFERAPEVVVTPEGREVDAADVLLEAYRATTASPSGTEA
jgi:ammonia channel protein AmtB